MDCFNILQNSLAFAKPTLNSFDLEDYCARFNQTFTMRFIFMLTILCVAQLSAQTVDATKLSTQSEVNFIETPKRGIQAKNGTIYWVHSDLETIVCFDADKNIRWKVNIMKTCGKPMVGAAEIRHIHLTEKHLGIVYGKHTYAEIAIHTGKVTRVISD